MRADATAAVATGPADRLSAIRRLAGRASWNILDQALVSMTNVVLSFLVARSVDQAAFGAFSMAFATYSVAILISRAVSSQPMVIRFADVGSTQFRTGASAAAGSAIALGMTFGAPAAALGVALGGELGHVFLAMGLVLPGLLVQDAWRMVFFAEGRPGSAAALDATWAVLQVAAVILLAELGSHGAWAFVLAWGLSAAAASVLGITRSGTFPHVHRALSWLRDHWSLTRYLLVEAVLLQGAYQGALLLVGALGGLEDAGSLRAAQVVLGPVSLLAASAFAFAVPELARRPQLSARSRRLATVAISVALATAAGCWQAIVLLLPDDVGEVLLGETWQGAESVMLASVVGQLGSVVAVGPACLIYALGRSRTSFRIHAVLSALIVSLGMAGLAVGGAVGAATGFAVAYWAVIPLWALRIRAISLEPPATDVAAAESSARTP